MSPELNYGKTQNPSDRKIVAPMKAIGQGKIDKAKAGIVC